MAWAQEDQQSVRANAASAGPEPEPEPALDPRAGLGPRLGWYEPEPEPEPEPDGAVEAEPPTLSLCLGSWCPGALLPSKLVDAALKRCACVRSDASGLSAGVSPRSSHAGAVLPPVRPHCVVHCCTTCRGTNLLGLFVASDQSYGWLGAEIPLTILDGIVAQLGQVWPVRCPRRPTFAPAPPVVSTAARW